MTEETQKCKWKHTPNKTPWRHPYTNQAMPGFPDEWTVTCVGERTLRTEPRAEWKLCPYCGKEIEWLTDPSDPSLPRTVPKLV